MTEILLAEHVPPDGHVLVLGAGGGLELRALAGARAGWRFDGVDPSPEMLALAEQATMPYAQRVALHRGYIDSAPVGPFDGAVSLLTFHFIPRDQRLHTLTQLRRRLKPGAPLVIAHISFTQDEPERSRWLSRHLEFSGTPETHVDRARQAMMTKLSILAPAEEEALLRDAGFSRIDLFYAGFSFRGWVAYAGTDESTG
jgi:tRNA (cmo5U34)-methyltransferase